MVRIKSAVYSDIKGVFFDYGGVIENLVPDEGSFRKGMKAIGGLLGEKGVALSAEELATTVKKGHREYERWYAQNDCRELPGAQIWSRFLLKKTCVSDAIRSVVESMGEELCGIYEFYLFRRRAARELKSVLMNLFFSGYTLSLISNTMSSSLIPERLRKFGIDKFFSVVALSVDLGVRKPNPEIFMTALRKTGLPASSCMYVGDTLSRDIEGSKRTGFGVSVLLTSSLTAVKDKGYKGSAAPDYRISSLNELYRILQ